MSAAGRYLRLKSSIVATMREAGDSSSAAKALSDAYQRFRIEARLIAEETKTTEEFDRLFPPQTTVNPSGSMRGYDPIQSGVAASEARAYLGGLSGWLDGFILDQ